MPTESRRTVFDEPAEVIALGYVWSEGNASGGRQELFTSLVAAERRLGQLIVDGKVKDNKATVHRLADHTWQPVAVHLPEPLRLKPMETPDER